MEGQSVKPGSKDAIAYTFDLSKVAVVGDDVRRTVFGLKRTLRVLRASKEGCGYGCVFCSVKNTRDPGFSAIGSSGEFSAAKAIRELDEILARLCPQVLKIFNNGNIFYGQERGTNAEMHELFWEMLPAMLKKHRYVEAVEFECRLDEFVDSSPALLGVKEILRNRISDLNADLGAISKSLRLILALEYIGSDIIREQSKFSQRVLARDENALQLDAIAFLKNGGIGFLAYVMLGGKLKERTLTPEEVVASAALTSKFAFENGAYEAIVNSQYLDPDNLRQEKRDGVSSYIPNERDMTDMIRQIVPHLGSCPKICGNAPRLRLTTDKEDIIAGTVGPEITEEFRQLVAEFNNAPDQFDFFRENFK